MLINDTIAAVATPPGRGGISVIRISGPGAVAAADKIFRAKNGTPLRERPSHTVTYGHIIRPEDGAVIDECLATVMLAPHTYTAEDVVELSVHGGPTGVGEVYSEILKAGARPAGPGEFTKRAFLNGRIDLSQAEAVIDIINSDNRPALHAAVNQLGGGVSRRINDIRDSLVGILAAIQAQADYADEGITEIAADEIKVSLEGAARELQALIDTAGQGRIVREGIKTVIAGRPNSGKSSLMNALAGRERAIVTDIPGTTRDVIEEYIDIGGVALRLLDTAGIRDTADVIEAEGVERARRHIRECDLLILVADSSAGAGRPEREILELAAGGVIVAANKADLPASPEFEAAKDMFSPFPLINISCLTGRGIDQLKCKIKEMYLSGGLEPGRDAMLINARHCQAACAAADAVNSALNALASGMPPDIIFIDLQTAIEALGEITGLTVSDEVVDRIFKDFCVGK